MSIYDKLDDEPERTDTEFTLGLRSILGIFFGLVLICGVFFGFGYSLGRSNAVKPSAAPQINAQSAATATTPAPITTVVDQSSPSKTNDPYDFNSNNSAQAKPSGAVLQTTPPATPSATTTQVQGAATPGATSSGTTPPASASAGTQPAGSLQTTSMATSPAKSATAPSSAPAAAPSQSPIMVQVAAISRSQDADVLISALQKRGFNATARRETSDHLLHIQIGPFPTRQQAQAMRSRLINDGYNAILK
ncbi:MAG TPA: SPOR domain-containing protein [Acidobacteriaceae bacterium]|nr:SPOR domain-containing protein [Acidobacteriaceae bacterium]